MVALDDRELCLLRQDWRGRISSLSRGDRAKVACLLELSLSDVGMSKEAAGFTGRSLAWLMERLFPTVRAAETAAPAVARAAEEIVPATTRAVSRAAPEVASSLPVSPVYAPLAGAAAPGAAAVGGAGAGAAAGAGSNVPGYLGRIVKSWQEMGTPAPWMTKYLGGLASPAAKGMKYLIFPGGPLLTGWSAAQGQMGPVTTLSNLIGPLATLPFGLPAMAAETAFSYLGAPKIDEMLGWKPRAQREAEMYNAGARQGIQEMAANAPSVSGTPPRPGAFYQPTMAYTPMGQMETEQAGRLLRGEG
jgi:hypothetical protein